MTQMGIFDFFKKKSRRPQEIVEKLSEEIELKKKGLEPLVRFSQSMPIYHDVLSHHKRTFNELEDWYRNLV